jgi:hypothetical protein
MRHNPGIPNNINTTNNQAKQWHDSRGIKTGHFTMNPLACNIFFIITSSNNGAKQAPISAFLQEKYNPEATNSDFRSNANITTRSYRQKAHLA